MTSVCSGRVSVSYCSMSPASALSAKPATGRRPMSRRSTGEKTAAASLDFPELNLSVRQREIVDLLVLGKSNKEMADHLCLSTDTIKAHLQHIFRKIGVSSRLEAVVYFLTGQHVS